MERIYICCNCQDGPKVWDAQPQCVGCSHDACKNCTWVGFARNLGRTTRGPFQDNSQSQVPEQQLEAADEPLNSPTTLQPVGTTSSSWVLKTSPSLSTNRMNIAPAHERLELEEDAIYQSSAYSSICGDFHFSSVRRNPGGKFAVGFDLDASFMEFFDTEIDDPEDFGNMLCLNLSGSSFDGFASTCQQYATRFWGDEEWRLAQRVVMACKIIEYNTMYYEEETQVKYHLIFRAGLPGKVVMVGTGSYILKVAAVLSWMASICQLDPHLSPRTTIQAVTLPEYPTRINSDSWTSTQSLDLMFCMKPGNQYPSLFERSLFDDMIDMELLPAHSRNPLFFKIRANVPNTSNSQDPAVFDNGGCWLSMFPKHEVLMAVGFPIPKRTGEIGLEIDFDVMVTLGRVSYLLELPIGSVLKGYSTMLIPTTGKGDNSIQWHYIEADPPDQPLSAECIPESVRPEILDLDVDKLRGYRSFVGYCSEVQVNLGKRDSGYQNVQMSGAENDSSTLRLGREISPTMGTSGMGIFGAGIASKVILTKGLFAGVQQEETRLEDRLLNSKNSPALLYDVERKTGFLVPELSLVLQILHIWAARQPDSVEILRKVPFISNSATNTAEEAFKAVILNKKVILREAYAEEKPLFLMTKLKDIFLAMEKRKEQRRLIKESSISLPGLPYLRGWELLDVAACRPSWEKRIKLEPGSAHSWYKIARDNDDMIVFFSKGMADAITSNPTRVCPAWNPLPQDHYLLASVQCVRRLSEINGGTGKGIKLTRKLFLCNDKDTNPFGVCPKTMDTCCSHIHSLVTRGPDKEVLLEEYGAVLLGRPSVRKEEARGYNSIAMPEERTSKGFQLYSRIIDRKS